MNELTDIHGNLTEPNAVEADRVEDLAEGLYRRLEEETEKLLVSQLKLLGATLDDWKEHGLRETFPEDSRALAQYSYKGRPILGLRIAANDMGIEFDVPKLTELPKNCGCSLVPRQVCDICQGAGGPDKTETQAKGEVQDERNGNDETETTV